jgi:hypothetical protein
MLNDKSKQLQNQIYRTRFSLRDEGRMHDGLKEFVELIQIFKDYIEEKTDVRLDQRMDKH